MECCNAGRGGGETGSGSPGPFFLFTPAPEEAAGSPRLPRPIAMLVSASRCLPAAPWAWTCGPDHTVGLGYSCGFPLCEAAVVASSKVAVDQQQLKPKGLFIAGWPRGLEQGLRPGAVQRLLFRAQ